MSKFTPEMQKLAQQLYQDNKSSFDLLSKKRAVSGFEAAVIRVFGEATAMKTRKLGGIPIQETSRTDKHIRFLPTEWIEELNQSYGKFPGCENWWAGYAFIVWVELKVIDGIKGQLEINSELGPISDHQMRSKLIKTVEGIALEAGENRIRFPAGSTDMGRLYSQFLSKNTVTINEVRDTSEIERKLPKLIADFQPEFKIIAIAIRQATQS